MFNVETVEKPAEVEGFIVTFTPEQLLYVAAVIGHTVASGSIPQHSQGMYDALAAKLEAAGLVDTDWVRHGDLNRDVNPKTGVPYADRLFSHLGLRKV